MQETSSSPDAPLLLFKDRAPWLVAAPIVFLLVLSTVVMFGPMFSDRHHLMLVGLFPLSAYLIYRSIKKTCTEIEFNAGAGRGGGEEGIRIKTNFAEYTLSWRQVSQVTIKPKQRQIKLRTEIGEFILPKTFGKMEQLMKHLEICAAAHQIALIT